jgi:hypothetical protein
VISVHCDPVICVHCDPVICVHCDPVISCYTITGSKWAAQRRRRRSG